MKLIFLNYELSRMTSSCFKKCVIAQHDSELQVGEMACIDRCVGKYMQAQNQVGAVLQKFEEQVKQQEAAGVQNYSFKPAPPK